MQFCWQAKMRLPLPFERMIGKCCVNSRFKTWIIYLTSIEGDTQNGSNYGGAHGVCLCSAGGFICLHVTEGPLFLWDPGAQTSNGQEEHQRETCVKCYFPSLRKGFWTLFHRHTHKSDAAFFGATWQGIFILFFILIVLSPLTRSEGQLFV